MVTELISWLDFVLQNFIMAAPPPYSSEQPGVYPANPPPVNPSYQFAEQQYAWDPSKGAQQPGYPAQPGYPPQQPQPGYPPAQYPAQAQYQPAAAPAPPPQQQTIVIQQAPVVTGNCPVCRVQIVLLPHYFQLITDVLSINFFNACVILLVNAALYC